MRTRGAVKAESAKAEAEAKAKARDEVLGLLWLACLDGDLE